MAQCWIGVAVAVKLFTMAISFSSIANFFSGELKLIERAENAMQSNRLVSFTYNGTAGVVKAVVQPSMKKGSYSVTVSHMINTLCLYRINSLSFLLLLYS